VPTISPIAIWAAWIECKEGPGPTTYRAPVSRRQQAGAHRPRPNICTPLLVLHAPPLAARRVIVRVRMRAEIPCQEVIDFLTVGAVGPPPTVAARIRV
jgi:hypothetical protein